MKLFFNPKNILFKTVLLITVSLGGYNLYYLTTQTTPKIILITFYVLSSLGLGIIIFALIPWYGRQYKGLGIEDHFEKLLLPTTYLLLIFNVGTLYGFRILPLNILFTALFLTLIATNFILLFYHFKDKSKVPPSYFAANLYLKENENTFHSKK